MNTHAEYYDIKITSVFSEVYLSCERSNVVYVTKMIFVNHYLLFCL